MTSHADLFALSLSCISYSSFLFYSLTLSNGCETNTAKLLKFNAACMRGFLRELHFQIRKVINSADLFFNRLSRGGRFFLHCGAVENHFLFLITNFSGKTQLSFTTLSQNTTKGLPIHKFNITHRSFVSISVTTSHNTGITTISISRNNYMQEK